MPLIDAHRLKKERGSDSIEGLSINSAGGKFAIYFATYSISLKVCIFSRNETSSIENEVNLKEIINFIWHPDQENKN